MPKRKFTFLIILLIVTILTLTGIKLKTFSTQEIPLIKETPDSRYSAWIPYWDEERALSSLSNSRQKLVSLSPVWYQIDKRGQLAETPSQLKDQIKLKSQKVSPNLLPTVFNQFDAAATSKLLASPLLYSSLTQKLIDTAQEKGYQGWDIDFEEIPLRDKENFSNFIDHLADNLHQNQLQLSVSVHVQTGKESDREAARAQDWGRISQKADYIRIMAYDFHNSQTKAGPITPLDRYREVLTYTAKKIPVEKIVIGLPFYGYDWDSNGGKSLEYKNFQELLEKFNTTPTRDPISQALTIQYKTKEDSHTIWIEDSKSVSKKINLARNFGIYQFSFWRLGGEDPAIWNDLR